MGRKRCMALACGLWAVLAGPLMAQELGPEQLAAGRLRQLARIALHNDGAAQPAALTLATALLQEATKLNPADPELWRLRIEASQATGERGQIPGLLGDYLRAAPADDVAQLRLTEHLLADTQTAEQRAATYERMVDRPRAESLSDALRSRLAWSAAALHRDRGDDAAYRRMLKRALELDPANAPAAAAAFELFDAGREADDTARFGALLMWHAAEPVNPRVHLLVARTLLECGHYEPAAAWFNSADLLAALRGGLPPDEALALATDWALSLWGAGRVKQALQLIGSVKHPEEATPAAELQAIAGALRGVEDPKDDAARLLFAEHLRQADVPSRSGPGCESIGRMAQNVPEELRWIGESSTRFLTLRLTTPATKLRYGEPVRLTVQLTNISEIPLSVGPDSTVPTTLFLIPKVTTGGDRWRSLAPQVLDLYRSLTLTPGESITVEAQLDGGDLVRLMDDHPANPVQVSITGVLNPHLDADGKYLPGLLGASVVSRRIERPATRTSDAEVGAAIARLGSDPAEAMLAAAWLARIVGTLPAEREQSIGPIAAALGELYERSDAAGQSWIVSHLTPGEATRRRMGRLISTALQSDSRAVQYALLMAIADQPDAPELTALLRAPTGSPARRFAENLREVLNGPGQKPGR